jgi:hypothetical protein
MPTWRASAEGKLVLDFLKNSPELEPVDADAGAVGALPIGFGR